MHVVLADGPATEPVTVEELKAHLRINGDEDVLLASLIVAARLTLKAIRLAVNQSKLEYGFGQVAERLVALPLRPVRHINSIRVLKTPHDELPVSDYRLDNERDPARLHLNGNDLPPLQENALGIRVEFAVGFGTNSADVPKDLRFAVLQLAAHWYEIDDWAQVRGFAAVPPHIMSIVNAHRVARL